MKKLFVTIAALAALVACSKVESDPADVQKNSNPEIIVNITVDDQGPDTKAARTGWVKGDRINIWFDDVDPQRADENFASDMTIELGDDGWDAINIKETFVPKTAGVLTAVFESSNDLLNTYAYDDTPFRYEANPEVRLSSNGYATASYQTIVYSNQAYDYNPATGLLSADLTGYSCQTLFKVLVKTTDQTILSNASKYCLYVKNESDPSCLAVPFDGFLISPRTQATPYPVFEPITSSNTVGATLGVAEPDGLAFYYATFSSDGDDVSLTLTYDGNPFGQKYTVCHSFYPEENCCFTAAVSLNSFFPSPEGSVGKAPVRTSASRPDNECTWVQLWKDGPKFAEFNVGATITDYYSCSVYSVGNVGGLYPWHNANLDAYNGGSWRTNVQTGIKDVATQLWGLDWREPTGQELQALMTQCEFTWCDGTTVQYCSGCSLPGYKVSGLGEYRSNNIFLPLPGVYQLRGTTIMNKGSIGAYSSSTMSSEKVQTLILQINGQMRMDEMGIAYGESVRAVLNEDPIITTGTAAVSSSAGRTNNSCDWVQLWEDGPKFAKFNVGATIDSYGALVKGKEKNSSYGFQYFNTANVGGEYCWHWPGKNHFQQDFINGLDYEAATKSEVAKSLWGNNWREPTKEELEYLLYDESLVRTWCISDDPTEVVHSYCDGCYLTGLKISGQPGTIFENNDIFLPTNYLVLENGVFHEVGQYWSSTERSDTEVWALLLDDRITNKCEVGFMDKGVYQTLVRAVLDE